MLFRSDEISFHGLAASLTGVAQSVYKVEVNAVFAEYKTSGLKDMRDKYVDHKDLKLSGDPSTAFINLPAKELVESCSRLIDRLNRLYRDFFPDNTSINYFSDFYSPGINEFVECMNQRL